MFRTAVAAFLLVSLLAAAQSPSAVVQPADVDPTQEQAKRPGEQQDHPNNAQQDSPAAPVANAGESPSLQERPDDHAQDSDREGSDSRNGFWTAFWTDIRITDVLIALFTGILAVVTGFLWRSTNDLWTETKNLAKLARDEFHTAHSPSLTVRRTRLRQDDNGTWGIDFVLVNTGHLTALNVTGVFDAVVAKRKKAPKLRAYSLPRYSGQPRSLSDVFGIHGEQANTLLRDERRFLFLASDQLSPESVAAIKADTDLLVFMGRLHYKDELGNARESAFYRSYRPSSDRFMSAKSDPEYEHQPASNA